MVDLNLEGLEIEMPDRYDLEMKSPERLVFTAKNETKKDVYKHKRIKNHLQWWNKLNLAYLDPLPVVEDQKES